MKRHTLKCWPEYFDPMKYGAKTFDVRVEDGERFEVDDFVEFREWRPSEGIFTGEVLTFVITYVYRETSGDLDGPPGLIRPDGSPVVVLGLRAMPTIPELARQQEMVSA